MHLAAALILHASSHAPHLKTEEPPQLQLALTIEDLTKVLIFCGRHTPTQRIGLLRDFLPAVCEMLRGAPVADTEFVSQQLRDKLCVRVDRSHALDRARFEIEATRTFQEAWRTMPL